MVLPLFMMILMLKNYIFPFFCSKHFTSLLDENRDKIVAQELADVLYIFTGYMVFFLKRVINGFVSVGLCLTTEGNLAV